MQRAAGERSRILGFSLIEMLAVVAIFALMATFVLPNIGVLSERALRDQAQELAARLELGRQRSVMTGVPHRIRIELEEGWYRLEWLRTEEPDAGARPRIDLDSRSPIPLDPPPEAVRTYAPIPGRFGRARLLEEDLFFAGVETPAGWVDVGETSVAFDRDGTTEYTRVHLVDADGRGLVLEVLPLAEAVRIADAEG